MNIDKLKAIDVVLDPNGPPLEDLIPLWNRFLEKKSLVICAPLSQRQLDMLVSNLSPGGLWLDVELVSKEELAAWDWAGETE